LHDELAVLGLAPDDVLDVSVNVNPYGPCPAVMRNVESAALHRYPDPTAAPARHAIARWLDASPAQVVVGNGAVDLLWALARATLRTGDAVAIVEPAFSEMRSAALCVGAHVVEHRLTPEAGFVLDPSRVSTLLRRERPRLAYVCTPGNPTGACVDVDVLVHLAAEHPETLFVVDVSFMSLSKRYWGDVVHASPRVAWLRSLTKDLGLPGLRVGFAVVPEDVAAAVEESRPPWSVNAPAQAAAIAASTAEAQGFVAESRDRLLADRLRLDAALVSRGLRVHPSETIYSLADLGASRSATALRASLLRRHAVLVRDATSFGLPHHIRLAARPARDLARLVNALDAELER
jgi:histidinol-phosphate/aromatic aminotransferase/cobyric acid decarboxylase-like protein